MVILKNSANKIIKRWLVDWKKKQDYSDEKLLKNVGGMLGFLNLHPENFDWKKDTVKQDLNLTARLIIITNKEIWSQNQKRIKMEFNLTTRVEPPAWGQGEDD